MLCILQGTQEDSNALYVAEACCGCHVIRVYNVIEGTELAVYNIQETIHRLCPGPNNSLLMYTGYGDASPRNLHQLKFKGKEHTIENIATVDVGQIIDVTYGMCYASMQNILVLTDMHSHKVAALQMKFSDDIGMLVKDTVMLWQQSGSTELIEGKKLHEPWGVCCDTETQRIFIAETGNLRLLVLDMCNGGVLQVICMKKYKLISDVLFFTRKPEILLHFHEKGRNKIVMFDVDNNI